MHPDAARLPRGALTPSLLPMSAFRLAHLSDPHLPFEAPLSGLRELWSKRSLSRLSWERGRRELQRPEVLAAVIADIRSHAADHLIVTGDITNFSYPDEFKHAATWLSGLGGTDAVSVIPGNHDALVPVPWPEGLGQWQDWMRSDVDRVGTSAPFPWLRIRNNVALIGLSSAVPTRPGMASGELGPTQLEQLEALLRELAERGLCRVIALHHPPADGVVKARKALRDRLAFQSVTARAGAEMILHGHSRDARFDPIAGPGGLVASLGLPSASAIPNPKDEGSRWNLLEFSREASGWQCVVTARVLNAGQDGFETAASYRLLLNT